MAKWWEVDPDLPTGVADFQRRAAYHRAVVESAQAQRAAQQSRQQAQRQMQPAQQQSRLWTMPAWLALLRRRAGIGVTAETPEGVGIGVTAGTPERAGVGLTVETPEIPDLDPTHGPPRVPTLAPTHEPPDIWSARKQWAERGETSFEQIVPKTYEERATAFWTRIFSGTDPEYWGKEAPPTETELFGKPYTTPRWLTQFNAAFQQMLSGAGGRVLRAWEKPEQRALMGGEPGGLGTREELEQEQLSWMEEEAIRRGLPTEEEIAAMAELDLEGAEKLRAERYLGQQDIRLDAKIREAGSFFDAALAHIGRAQQQFTDQVYPPEYFSGDLSEEEKAQIRASVDELAKQPSYPWLGRIWEELTARSEGGVQLEQVTGAATQAFIDPAYQVLEMGTAIEIIGRPESKNLQVEQWYPLTKRGSSLLWANAKEKIKADFAALRGDISREEREEAHRADLIAMALLSIADGTATAEEIALANENLTAEFVGQFIADPWNALFAGAGPSGQRLSHLSEAVERMTDVSAVSPAARDALRIIDEAVDAGDLAALQKMEQALAKRNISIPRKILNRLGEDARSPLALIPEAKVARDLEDITIVLAPAIDIAETGDDALELLRLWAEDPASLRPVFGRVPQSRVGLKAQTVLRATMDRLQQLPSARAVPFNAARFWNDLEGVMRATLLEAYGFKEPGPVLGFFLKYKRLQSEFYLNPAMGGLAYGTRNMLGDGSGMFVDGVLSFEKRANIEDYFRAFSTGREDFVPTTRRVMTAGVENIEGLTGSKEIQSIFPGALGEWSKKGQKLTRHGEFFGQLPYGEEPRYLRALYAAHKWYWNETALKLFPDLPASAVAELGEQAEHLRRMIALEPNLGVRRQLLTEFLEGRKGAQFEPTQYLTRAEMNAVSPETIGRVRRELRKLNRDSGVDEVHRVIEDVVRAVDEDEAAKLAMMEQLPPSLHVTTDVSEVEAAEDLVQSLRDIVARTGDEDQARRLAEIEEAIPKVERAFDEARTGAVDNLMTVPDEDGLDILMHANARVEESQGSWRQLLDETRAKAIAEYRQPPNKRRPAAEIWEECFHALDEGWTTKAHDRIKIYQEASEQLERLRAGESVESILGKATRTRRAEKWLLEASELPEPPANYIPGNVYRGANEDAKFARLLEWNRAKLDNARINAWRAVYGTEPENYGRMLDLLDSAERDIELWGKQTVGEQRRLLQETEKEVRRLTRVHKDPHLLQLAIDQAYETYWAKRHDNWNKFWRGSEQRWQIAERDVLLENWAYGQRMEPPVTPPKTRGPRRPKPGPVQAGDEDIVKTAVLKRDVDWTADERAAIERWVAAGQKLPEKELPIIPGIRGAPPYTRSQLVADLKAIPNVAEEQVDAWIEVLDKTAKTWSKETGYSPEKFYAMILAGAHRGNAAEFTLFQQAEHYLDPRFKEWFGAGVVREGEWFDVRPKTLYRGQRHDVDFFRVNEEGFIWMTDDPEYAEWFATKDYGRKYGKIPEGAQIYPVYTNMANPIDLSAARIDLEMGEFEQVLAERLAEYGIEYGVDTTTINAVMPAPGWGGLFGQYITLDEPFLWVRANKDALLEAAWDRGLDGIILHEQFPRKNGTWGTATSYIAFEPNQVKSVWNRAPTESPLLLWQDSEFAPQWWYGIERTINAKMPNRASIEQITNILNKGGVKKEELRWTGIEWWLNNQEGMVTKEDVLSFLEGNRLEVGEVMRGETGVSPVILRAAEDATRELDDVVRTIRAEAGEAGIGPSKWDQLIYEARELNSPTSRAEMNRLVPGSWDRYEEALLRRNDLSQQLRDAEHQARNLTTQWAKYVEPGAAPNSYREIELTLPKWVGEDAAKVKELRRLNDEARRQYLHLGDLRHRRQMYRDMGRQEELTQVTLELHKAEKEWETLHARKRDLEDMLGRPLDYDEPHWQQDKNVVAHVRFTEHTGPNGERVLFIEEGQSAWHQTAREKGGYAPMQWPEDWTIVPLTKENGYAWKGTRVGPSELRPIDPNERLSPRIWIDEIDVKWRIRQAEPGAEIHLAKEPLPKRQHQWRLWEGSHLRGTFDSLEEAQAAGLRLAPDPEVHGVFDGKGALRATGTTPERARESVYRNFPLEAPFSTSWDELLLKRMMRYAAENDYDAIAWTSGAQQARRYPIPDERAVITRLEWQHEPGQLYLTGYDDLQFRGNVVFTEAFDVDGTGTLFGTETTLEKVFGAELAEKIENSVVGWAYSVELGELVVGDTRLAEIYDRIFPYSAKRLTKRWQVDVGEMTLDFGEAPRWRISSGHDGRFVVLDEQGAVMNNKTFGSHRAAEEWMYAQQVKYGKRQVPGFRINPGMRRDLLNEGLALYQPGAKAPRAAMSVLEDGRAVLRFFEGANFSSVVHEFGHVLRRILPADELRLVEKWVGVKAGDFDRLYAMAVEHAELAEKAARTAEEEARMEKLAPLAQQYREAEEQFANGFVRYMIEGIAPIPELQLPFRKIRQWLTDIYKEIKGSNIDVELSDEIRGVFDRLIAGEEARPRQPVAGAGAGGVPPGKGVPLFQKADELFDAKSLAQKAIDSIPNEGWTLSLQGEPHAGGGWAVSLPGAETPLGPGEIDVEHFVQWLDKHAQDFATDPTLKFGGWTEGDKVVLDISTIVQNADEAMVCGWEWKQRAIFNFSTWESVDVTYEAAQEAAKRLGVTLQRAPGEPAIPLVGKRAGVALTQPGEILEQRGFWNVDPDNWAEYRRASNQAGATPGPVPADLLQRSTEATRQALRKIEDGLVRDWDQWQDVLAGQQVRRDLDSWFTDSVVPNWYEQRATAFDFARQEANFALLDYSHRYNLDQWLSCFIPYHYWFTRAGWNWAKRLASRPGMLAAYIRMMDGLKLANERAGRRRRFAQMFNISAPWLPDWMGDTLAVDPRSMLAPFSQIFQGDWDDAEDSKHGLRAAFDTARQFGLRPYHIWDWLYQTGKFAQAGDLMGMDPEQAQKYLGPEYQNNFPFILPQTGVIRGATALARELGVEGIPPGGINIEAPVRRLLGLPSGEIWDPYRVNRMLGGIAAERQNDKQLAVAALDAQELMQRDTETQTGKPWLEDSELARQTAEELGWTSERRAKAQEVLIQALQRAALERGVGSLGWLIGPRLAVEPAGERAQLEMAEEARGMVWGPEQPEGSREAYEQFKRENWAMYPRSTQYNVMPGEQEYEAMPPGARANWLILREQKEHLHEMFDQAVDSVLRDQPWNWDARGDLEDQRRVAIAELEKKYPLPDFEGDLPAYLYGMNPDEMWDAATEKILYQWNARMPDPGKFESEDEGVDWDAYNRAEEGWFAQLPKMFSFGTPQGGVYQGMDPITAMRNFLQRFDSPLEAAHKVYEKEIAAPAWAEYNKIKGQWEMQWPGMADLEDRYWDLDVPERRIFIRENPELGEYWDWKGQQGNVYQQTVGKVPAMNATALIPAILKQYQTRGWTEEQLKQALAGVVFPSLAEQQELKRAQRGEEATTTTAPPTAAAASDYRQPKSYTAKQLEYLKERAKAEWARNQQRYGRWGGGGGGGAGGYTSRRYPRWRPPSTIRGGPFRY